MRYSTPSLPRQEKIFRAEADGETFHMHAAPPGGEKMAQLMHKDRPAEKQHDEKDRPDVGEEGVKEIVRHREIRV